MIPEWLLTLAGIALCILLIPYVLGPILVFFTLRFRMPPTVVPVDPRVHPLPAEARNYLAEAYRALTAEGFELVGTMLLPDLVPNVKTLFAMYVNRPSSDMAMSAIIVAQGGVGGELKTSYVEFVRRFDDGVVVQTNNSSELSAFKRMPGEFTTKFWQVRDIRQLYGLHQLLVERFRQRGQSVNRLDTEYSGDAVRYVAKAVLEETFRDQVGTGYLAEDASGFRPSFKGAWIMAWQELWPVKGIRRWRERHRAERLLAELHTRLPDVF
ncbi:MAG TPA: hypothetical protein PLF81_06050 [Candidatus Anammoximicrobium sp.]|nr:hypothetical protein [Candidatus Anammoximicrobium sp.]